MLAMTVHKIWLEMKMGKVKRSFTEIIAKAL
jgi:hypothetical protein